jgi:phosphoribosyl-ATP pyrophosphohydrolase
MSDTLHDLEAVLVARRAARPEGSYSVQLFDDRDLRLRKIMEEAFEVCLELGRPDVDSRRAASEAADLLYHLQAGLVAADVRLDDVLAELEARR